MGPKRIVLKSAPVEEKKPKREVFTEPIDESKSSSELEIGDSDTNSGFTDSGLEEEEYQQPVLTARQRAMFSGGTSSPVPDEPLSEPHRKKDTNIDDELRKSEVNRRRKAQRDEKVMQHRADTIKKILNKQQAPKKEIETRINGRRNTLDCVREGRIQIVMRKDEEFILLNERDLPISRESVDKDVLCSAPGCSGQKTCLHSSALVPMCGSLNCYKKIKL